MILVAGALWLLGVALFVAGLATGVTAYFWGCVASCAVAVGVLVAARRAITRSARPGAGGGAAGQADAQPARAHGPSAAAAPVADHGEPPLEVVEVPDLLIVVDLSDEVLVVDEHPRYHVDGCAHLHGRSTIPLPLDEARADGFTPCGTCRPDRTLAQRARARRSGAGA